MWITLQFDRLIFLATLALVFGFAETGTRRQIAEARSQEVEVPADTVITLERTACYGTCPDYKIVISADGSVIFEGRRFVKTVGPVKSMISHEQLRAIITAFEKVNYFEMNDRYDRPEDGCKQWATDNPSAITSIRINGKSKTVSHYYGCHGIEVLKDLSKLERAIDTAVNSEQWIR